MATKAGRLPRTSRVRVENIPAPRARPPPAPDRHGADQVRERGPQHEFWPDDNSTRDALAVDATLIHGARQVTDAFLPALAVRHGGAFATFDGSVAAGAVHCAGRRRLVVP